MNKKMFFLAAATLAVGVFADPVYTGPSRRRKCACARVWITVDGKKSASPVARFDNYCTYHRIATLGVFNGADGVHTVEITVDKDQPSRQPVAFRLKNPAVELAKPKYQGTKFWPAKIMLVGDLQD
ncbi:MAG: hypothetical protein IJQ00_04210 [Kiritimatiellae bacterium]|nr:hypothetical protein [Kiritimatiellia bacterium]